MSVGKLYGPPKGNGRVYKAYITAKLCGLELDRTVDFEFMKSNKTPEYLAKFPLGQVPAFESKDGLTLTESNAIAIYLAGLQEGAPLLGTTSDEKGKVMQYIFFSETQIVPHVVSLIYPFFGLFEYVEQTEKLAYQRLESSMEYLEKEIGTKKFLVGDRLTMADIILGENLSGVFGFVMDPPYRAKFPNVTTYFKNYRALPEISQVTEDTMWAEKPLVVAKKN